MVTKISSLFRRQTRSGDGATLAFVSAALRRVIASDYRDMLLGQAREIESRLSEVDRFLTACDRCATMNELAEKIEAVHVSLAALLSNLADPSRIDPATYVSPPG
jgi:hypothetical protein